MPPLYFVGPSLIHGRGIIAHQDLETGTPVDTCIVFRLKFLPSVTPMGSMVNHSAHPNCIVERKGSVYNLVTSEKVLAGKELTVNYDADTTPWFIRRSDAAWRGECRARFWPSLKEAISLKLIPAV